MEVKTVSYADAFAFGCPHCGHKHFREEFSHSSITAYYCYGCKQEFAVLPDGVQENGVSVRVGPNLIFPRRQKHPFRGSGRRRLTAR